MLNISVKNLFNILRSGFASYSYVLFLYSNLIVGYPTILKLSAISVSLSQSTSWKRTVTPSNEPLVSSLNAFHSGSAFLDKGHQSV